MRDMTESAGLTVATWNTQWATPTTERGSRVAAKLRSTDADIMVVTEGVRALLPAGGYVHDAGADWGYTPKPKRRKVIVWSRLPLTLETVGGAGATLGRLAPSSHLHRATGCRHQ